MVVFFRVVFVPSDFFNSLLEQRAVRAKANRIPIEAPSAGLAHTGNVRNGVQRTNDLRRIVGEIRGGLVIIKK